MKSQLHIKNIQFMNLLCYEKALSLLTPIPSIGTLNSTMHFTNESIMNLYIQDTTSLIKISIPYETVNNTFENNTAYQVDYKKFLYAINQYKDNTSNIEILVDQEDMNILFTIKNNSDKISLPVISVTNTKIEEYEDLFTKPEDVYNFSTENAKNYLITMNNIFKNSILFVSKDEQKNNAGALYLDKFIVNDRRHIYVQNFNTNCLYDSLENSYIPIHKKNMRIFSETLNTENSYNLSINKDYTRIFISTIGFEGVFNNALANIAPPSEEDIETIEPSTLVFKSTVADLYKACSFFGGFYSSSSDIKALSIKAPSTQELMIYLKDNGVAGFGEYSIEKIISSTELSLIAFEEPLTVTIIYDSIKDFLSKEDDSEKVELYFDNDSMAVMLKTNTNQIYLSKLQG